MLICHYPQPPVHLQHRVACYNTENIHIEVGSICMSFSVYLILGHKVPYFVDKFRR